MIVHESEWNQMKKSEKMKKKIQWIKSLFKEVWFTCFLDVLWWQCNYKWKTMTVQLIHYDYAKEIKTKTNIVQQNKGIEMEQVLRFR